MLFECGLVGESALATVEFMGCMTGKGTSHKEKHWENGGASGGHALTSSLVGIRLLIVWENYLNGL
jgi:hypothetical protein